MRALPLLLCICIHELGGKTSFWWAMAMPMPSVGVQEYGVEQCEIAIAFSEILQCYLYCCCLRKNRIRPRRPHLLTFVLEEEHKIGCKYTIHVYMQYSYRY